MSNTTMLNQSVTTIKDAGYDVYLPENPTTYGYYTDGKNVAYFQVSTMKGVEYSYVHKPSITNGTGAQAGSVQEALGYKPDWLYGTVEKWPSPEVFLNKNWQKLVKV